MGFQYLLTKITSLIVISTVTVFNSSGEGTQIGEVVDEKVSQVAEKLNESETAQEISACLLYTSPSPRDS